MYINCDVHTNDICMGLQLLQALEIILLIIW